jgi:hypothetical protein
MLQDHLSLRAMTERRLAVVRDAQARAYGAVEAGHHRPLATVFGHRLGTERVVDSLTASVHAGRFVRI